MGAVMSCFVGSLVYSIEAPADGAVNLAQTKSWGDKSFSSFTLPNIVSGILNREARELFESFLKVKADGPYAEFARGILMGSNRDHLRSSKI
jgi:hypothetical protein